MCGPTKLSSPMHKNADGGAGAPNDETSMMQNSFEASSSQEPKHRGFLYGTLSLALLVTAASVVMGFYQSKRDSLECDVQCIGTMTSARSTLTLIGSTIIGKCSDSTALDRIGGARRVFLFLGVASSALDVLMSFRASSISALWISMIPSALFQQNFTVLKALFIEYQDESASAAERAGSVGKLGMAVGLAFMAGPLLGSVLFEEYRSAAMFAGACLLGSTFFILLLPSPSRSTSSKKNEPVKSSEKGDTSSSPSSLLGFSQLVPAAKTPPALFLMVSRIFMGLSFHIFQTIWTVALRERFNFGPKDYGRYFSLIGFTFAISQGFVAKYLVKTVGESDRGRKQLLLMCAVVLGGGRFIAYQTNSIKVVYAVFGLIVTALGVINTIFTADTSKIANPSELGGLFGVLARYVPCCVAIVLALCLLWNISLVRISTFTTTFPQTTQQRQNFLSHNLFLVLFMTLFASSFP